MKIRTAGCLLLVLAAAGLMADETEISIQENVTLTAETVIEEPQDRVEAYTAAPVLVEGNRLLSAEKQRVVKKLEDTALQNVSSVPDMLAETSGLDIQNRGVLTPRGSQVRLRGLDERRMLVTLDGRTLNGTGVMGGQFVDWSMLSLQGWAELEVIKGASSAAWGNTLAGVINLIPRVPEEGTQASLSLGGGSFETFSEQLRLNYRRGNAALTLSGEWLRSEGFLRNGQAQRMALRSDLYILPDTYQQLRVGLRYTEGSYGMPVANYEGTDDYKSEFVESQGSILAGPGVQFPAGDMHGDGSFYNKHRIEVDLNHKMKWTENFRTEATLYYNDEYRRDEIWSAGLEQPVLIREAVPDRSGGVRLKADWSVSHHELSLGADGNLQGYGGTRNTMIRPAYFTKAIIDGADAWDATRCYGIYLQDSWRVLDQLELYAGLREEIYRGTREADQVTAYNPMGKPLGFETVGILMDENALLPKFGIYYTADMGCFVRASAARATRFPDNPVFYWFYGGYRPEVDPSTDVVRRDLTFEDAQQYEASMGWQNQAVRVSLGGYSYDIENYIRWIFGYAPSRLVYNIDSVSLKGLELDMDWKLTAQISLFANGSWQTSCKEGDVFDATWETSDELPELPEWKAAVGIGWQGGQGRSASFKVRYTGVRSIPVAESTDSGSSDGLKLGTEYKLKELKEKIMADLLLSWPLGPVVVAFEMQNLGDVSCEDEYGFPAARRYVGGRAEWKF